MDPAERPKIRTYVVLLFIAVNPEYYELSKEERSKLNDPHVKELSKHLKNVSLISLKGTGLSRDILVEVLESRDLIEIEKMIETYKVGAKSKYGTIENVMITEKCMVREMTG